jgi:hypothetical protein
VLATYDKPPPGALPPPADVQGVYIMSFEMDGAGACTGMLTPNDRIIEVDGEPADTLQQVTSRFKGSAHEVKVKVASRVVFGGFMLKKGELNTEFQIRWFLLVDEDECAVLRYYDGRNAVTRKLKGEIKISPQEVRSVRSYLHEDVVTGAKTPGVVINQAGRTWELLTKTAAESRMWVRSIVAQPGASHPLPPSTHSLHSPARSRPSPTCCTVCNRCRCCTRGCGRRDAAPSPRCRATTTCSARSPRTCTARRSCRRGSKPTDEFVKLAKRGISHRTAS